MTAADTLAAIAARRQALPAYGHAAEAMPTERMKQAALEAAMPHLVDVLTDGAKTLAALQAVLDRHEPIPLQETDPTTGRPHEPGTGHDWTPACRGCSEPEFVEAVDAGEEVWEGDYVERPCPDVEAITDALEA